jgi:hypothetical protein
MQLLGLKKTIWYRELGILSEPISATHFLCINSLQTNTINLEGAKKGYMDTIQLHSASERIGF